MSEAWPFEFVDHVRYGDLDANRHLNNVAVHQFFESARVAYMRSLVPDLSPADPLGTIFAETHVNFRSPGFYPEVLVTSVRPERLRRSSVRLAFKIVARDDERLVADGWGTIVGFDYEAGRAQRLQPGFRQALIDVGAVPDPEETP